MTNWKKVEGSGNADVWNFETQPELEGEFVKVETGIGPNNSNLYHFLVGGDLEQEEVVIWGSTVLDTKLAGLNHGDKVKIDYLGKAKGKRGTEYRNYDVFTEDKGAVPF